MLLRRETLQGDLPQVGHPAYQIVRLRLVWRRYTVRTEMFRVSIPVELGLDSKKAVVQTVDSEPLRGEGSSLLLEFRTEVLVERQGVGRSSRWVIPACACMVRRLLRYMD